MQLDKSYITSVACVYPRWVFLMLVLMIVVPTHVLTSVLTEVYENGTEIAMTLEYETETEEKEKEKSKEKNQVKTIDHFLSTSDLNNNYISNLATLGNHHKAMISLFNVEIATPPPRI